MTAARDREMPEQSQTAEEEVLFDAVLSPHRSLGPRGFLLLMGAVAAVSFAAGLAFALAGAWPVMGFFGFDALLIYFAFRVNYRRARRRETLQLTREALRIEKIDAAGRVRRIDLQPYWLQVRIDDPPRNDSELTLQSHGRHWSIGSFLSAEEKGELAEALRDALQRVRATPETGPRELPANGA